jgi:hypothetical protein
MAEEDEIAAEAYGATTAIGAGLAEVAGVGGPVGVAVAGAAAVGVGIGMGIEYLTDGAVSDTLSDGLLGLVGEEESYQAAQSFDDGDYLEGVGHMLSGAGETIGEAASDAAEWVGETASDAYDAVADTAGDVVDFLNPFD